MKEKPTAGSPFFEAFHSDRILNATKYITVKVKVKVTL